MARKIVDKEGFHIPVRQEPSFAEQMPDFAKQAPREDAAQTQQEEEKRQENAAATQVIGKEEVAKMRDTLKKYIASKAQYDERYKNNFDTYTLLYNENNELKNAEIYKSNDKKELIKRRRGAQTLKVILNKHADAMDNYPEAIFLPRSKDDEAMARQLNCVVPAILERNGFTSTYSIASTDKLVGGANAYSVTWDSKRDGGLGEVCVKKENILNLFWQPFIEDIQDSKYFFNVALVDIEEAAELYPQLEGISAEDLGLKEFKTYDNTSESFDKAAIIDCYYKRGGVVHMCKFCGEELIFASENEPENYPQGYYIDGKYPFVVKPLFHLPNTPMGFSFVDICRAPQEYRDELRCDILKNLKINSKTRSLVNSNAGVHMDDMLDLDQEMIEVDNFGDGNVIQPFETKDVAPGGGSMLSALDDEIKDTTGTNDAANGASAAGVTSGNAIAALQEAGGKISRDINKMEHEGFIEICGMIIERMRQFYTPGRMFRITGENKQTEYQEFDSEGLRPQPIEVEGNPETFWRLPIFDIQVKAQRSNPFTTMNNNQRMMDMFNMGMFAAERADEALIALEGMQFEGKEKLMDMIRNNKTLLDAVNELAQQNEMLQAMLNMQDAQQAAAVQGAEAALPGAPVEQDNTVQKSAAVPQGTQL